MKALDKVKTDDLNDEQKKLLADFIKKEMMTKIEDSVKTNSAMFAEQIKKYLNSEDNEEESVKEVKVSKK